MKSAAARFFLVLVTAPDLKIARRLAQAALGEKLVACANLVPRIESHYWWQGKLERGNEVLVIFKATRNTISALEKLILKLHPYDTPEFIALPVNAGTERYMKWWDANCRINK